MTRINLEHPSLLCNAHLIGEWYENPRVASILIKKNGKTFTVTTATLFDKLDYQFPDRHITLWFFLVEDWEGEPWGKEGQPGCWMARLALDPAAFPPANEPVISKLIAQG